MQSEEAPMASEEASSETPMPSEDAPMATAHREYIRKNQRSFEETMLMEEHDCEEHIRHQVHSCFYPDDDGCS